MTAPLGGEKWRAWIEENGLEGLEILARVLVFALEGGVVYLDHVTLVDGDELNFVELDPDEVEAVASIVQILDEENPDGV